MQDTFQQRLDFLGLGEDVETRMAPIADLVERHVEGALERFNAQVSRAPSAARFLYGRDRIEANGEGLAEHWRAMARGQFDLEFARAAQRMGLRHARIGLEPRWHVGSYASLVDTLVRGIIQDGLAAAIRSRKGGLNLFGRPDHGIANDAVGAIAEGLATLMAGVLLDIDLSLSGYIGRLREEGLNAVEAQRQRLRLAVEKAGRTLELAAEGQKPDDSETSDSELAPLYAGAERLADRVIALLADLEGSSAAMHGVAQSLAQHAATLLAADAAPSEQAQVLAGHLDGQAGIARQMADAIEGLERQAKAQARQRGGLRKAARVAESAAAALGAEARAEENLAEQLDALHLSAQLLAAQGDDEGVRALSAGLGRLSGQLRTHHARSTEARRGLARSLAGQQAMLERMAGACANDAAGLTQTAQAARNQAAALADIARVAHGLHDALAVGAAQNRSAQEGLREALAATEAFADLVRVFDQQEAEEPVEMFPAQDQAALAAHWHAG
ncbi:protoglobin domain-containing protein [Devosia sp. Naph2]|uniref:protoglobin domain-containing protein n=1 Tax=Devosia polycyclovorans TaxID=3345148 RepID=UPI0035CFEB50